MVNVFQIFLQPVEMEYVIQLKIVYPVHKIVV
jgi:hypothetical protein